MQAVGNGHRCVHVCALACGAVCAHVGGCVRLRMRERTGACGSALTQAHTAPHMYRGGEGQLLVGNVKPIREQIECELEGGAGAAHEHRCGGR